MERVLITGHAQWGSEAFDFEIGPWSGGVGLMMRHTGYGDPKLAGGAFGRRWKRPSKLLTRQ